MMSIARAISGTGHRGENSGVFGGDEIHDLERAGPVDFGRARITPLGEPGILKGFGHWCSGRQAVN
jgi:hypothetical protein